VDFGNSTGNSAVYVSFKTPKRVPPTMTVYDSAGNAGFITTDATNNAQVPTAVDNISEKAFKVFHVAARVEFHWVADART
jgi:hypothetical protein